MFNKHFRIPKHHVLLSDSVRHPIRFRPPPDQIPSATQSDSVRHPIGFRPPPNQIPSATRSDSVRCPMKLATVIPNINDTQTQHQ